MIQHTPLPWNACCLSRRPHFIFGPDGERSICSFVNADGDAAEISANASFIIQAVNQHEALKASNGELLEFARACVARLAGDWDNPALVKWGALAAEEEYNAHTGAEVDILNQARAAISRAESLKQA